MTPWSREFRWLVDLCRHDLTGGGSPPYDELLDPHAFIRLAEAHRLLPIAERSWLSLAACSLAPPPPAVLRQRAGTARRRSFRAATHLVRLARAFEADGITWTALKGPALSLQLYGDPTVRTARDLDVIVPEPQIGAAVQAAGRAGWTTPTLWREVTRITRRYDMEMQPTEPGQPLLEIHTALGPPFVQFALDAFAVPGRGMVRMGDAALPTLVGPAQATYVAWHGARGLWYRLCWLVDYAALRLRAPDLSDQILATARACGGEIAVRAGADLIRDVLAIELPPLPAPTPPVARRVATVTAWGRERLGIGVDSPDAWSAPGSYRWLWREVAQQDRAWAAAAGALSQLARPTAADVMALGVAMPLAIHRLARPYFATRRFLRQSSARSAKVRAR